MTITFTDAELSELSPPASHAADVHDVADTHDAAEFDRSATGTIGRAADIASIGGIVFAGAIFGFFFAWVCSAMWGLDNADPRVAIEAMQEVNEAVRNAVFFPAFFLTPVVLGVAAWLLRRSGRSSSARWFGAGAVVYLLGGLMLTAVFVLPLNDELAEVVIPADRAEAEAIWTDYSGEWQLWNIARTVFCGVALTMAGLGLRNRNR